MSPSSVCGARHMTGDSAPVNVFPKSTSLQYVYGKTTAYDRPSYDSDNRKMLSQAITIARLRDRRCSLTSADSRLLSQQGASLKMCLLAPDGALRQLWDLVVIFFATLSVALLPINVFLYMHIKQSEEPAWLNIADVTILGCFAFDILVNFRTAFFNSKTGKICFDSKQIAIRYAKTWFIVDLCATFPFEYFCDYYRGPLHIPRTIKMIRCLKLLRELKISSFVHRTVIKIGWGHRAVELHQIAVLFILFFFIAHYAACVWYFIGTESGGWVDRFTKGDDYGIVVGDSMLAKYRCALFWALLTLSVDMPYTPHTPSEQIFSMFIALISVGFVAAIVSSMSSIIMARQTEDGDFQTKMRLLCRFLQKSKVPRRLKQKVRSYLVQCERHKYVLEDVQAMHLLSPPLHQELAYFAFGTTLEQFPLFDRGAALGSRFVRYVSSKARHVMFAPRDELFQRYELSTEVFFILHGQVQFSDKFQSGKLCVLGELTTGWFGEASLLVCREDTCRRIVFAQCVAFSELLALSRADFDDVVGRNSDWQYKVNNLRAAIYHEPESVADFSCLDFATDSDNWQDLHSRCQQDPATPTSPPVLRQRRGDETQHDQQAAQPPTPCVITVTPAPQLQSGATSETLPKSDSPAVHRFTPDDPSATRRVSAPAVPNLSPECFRLGSGILAGNRNPMDDPVRARSSFETSFFNHNNYYRRSDGERGEMFQYQRELEQSVQTMLLKMENFLERQTRFEELVRRQHEIFRRSEARFVAEP